MAKIEAIHSKNGKIYWVERGDTLEVLERHGSLNGIIFVTDSPFNINTRNIFHFSS